MVWGPGKWLSAIRDLLRESKDPEFIAYMERNIFTYGVVKTLFACGMVLGFFGLDLLLGLKNLQALFVLRGITTGLLLLNILLFFYRPGPRKNRFQMIVAYYILVVYSPVLTWLAGGYASSYWAGMNFILVFWLGLAPFGFMRVIGHALIFLIIYNGLLICLCEGAPDSLRIAEFNAYLVGTFVIGSVITFFNSYNTYKVFAANRELFAEREKSERLLLSILPREIANRLKVERGIIANKYESVTVLFSDLVGFTQLSEKMDASNLVVVLNDIFSQFDLLTEEYGLEKIKTIGDAYMVIGGAPALSGDHTLRMIRFAQDINAAMTGLSAKYGYDLKLRIGVHVGPVVAGVIGNKKFAYDLWGDTVNTASRMESHGIPGRIHVTQQVFAQTKDHFDYEDRGIREIKGKGMMHTYML
jgi:class 3 adenylate cyclase